MRTTFDSRQLAPPPGGSVVSVGVFDGVHRGHQAILARNVERARELGAVPTVVTFRRHPKRILLGRAPRMLTTLDHRLELFRRAGVGHAVALAFDEELRAMSAEDFTRDLLVDGLGARAFVLGFDSKFGHGRRGTPELLRELGHDVEVVDKVVVAGRAVSSTAIREAVELGDLEAAETMLGRPASVVGHVVRGDARGRTIGFPTANLDLHHELHPPEGVYACRARVVAAPDEPAGPCAPPEPNARGQEGGGVAGRSGLREPGGAAGAAPGSPGPLVDAVANIGYRPTVGGERPEAPLVEVHLLDFAGELYGERLELLFVRRLRGERRFDGLDALKAQIAEDCGHARRVLAGRPA